MLTEQLIKALRPMIGFRADPLSTTGTQDLGTDLVKTTTGLTLDQCHELLKLSTLIAAGPHGLEDLKAYLTNGRDDAIRALLTNLDTRLAEAGLSARLLSSVTYPPALLVGDAIAKVAGRRVGLSFMPKLSDITATVHRLRLFATGPLDAPLTVTLLQEGETEPLTAIVLEKGNSWFDFELPVFTQGNTYYLTYAEDDLGAVSAKNTLSSWPKAKSNCHGCKQACASHYIDGKAFSFDAAGNLTEYTDTNFGLSVVVSASGDLSGRLIQDPRRLLTALRHQMAVTFLEKIAYSTRHNGPTEEAINGALFALTDKDNTDRVPLKLDKALSTLVKSLQAEAGAALDVDDSDDITWGSL